MRSKLVLAALIFLSILPVYAQVAPAAKISGLPLGVGVGLVDYDTDYYYPYLPYWSGRMVGVSAWGNYDIWRGFGVAVEGNEILGGAPTPKDPRNSSATFYGGPLKEATIQGGIIYRYHKIFHVRPFAQAVAGMGKVSFPTENPFYTSETSPLYTLGGGVEYHAWNNFFLRGAYEYQTWKGFQINSLGKERPLHPAGATVGVTYYLRGLHRRY